MSLIYTLWIILLALIEISIRTHMHLANLLYIFTFLYIVLLALHEPQHLMYISFVWFYIYYICDNSLYVFHIYYRCLVNSEQCAVYQQQCCEHHGYWDW